MATKFKHHSGEAPGTGNAPGASANDRRDKSKTPAIPRAVILAGGAAMLLGTGTIALLRFRGDSAPTGTHIPGISAPGVSGGNTLTFSGNPNDPDLQGRSPAVDIAAYCPEGEQVAFVPSTNQTLNGNTQMVNGPGSIGLECVDGSGNVTPNAPRVQAGTNPSDKNGAYGGAICANGKDENPTLTATTNGNEVDLTTSCGPGGAKDANTYMTLGSAELVP